MDKSSKMWYRSEEGEDDEEELEATATATTATSVTMAAATTTATTTARLLGSTRGFGARRTTLRPSYGMGMWQAIALLACLTATHAAVFTEGGAVLNGQEASNKPTLNENYENFEIEKELQDQRFNDELLKYYLQEQKPVAEKAEIPSDAEEEYISYILDELNRNQQNNFYNQQFPEPGQLGSLESANRHPHSQQQQKQDEKVTNEEAAKKPSKEQKTPETIVTPNLSQQKSGQFDEENPINFDELLRAEQELEVQLQRDAAYQEALVAQQQQNEKSSNRVLNELAQEIRNQESVADNKERLEDFVPAVDKEPSVPQKKGQNEFVSFVEPVEQPLKQTLSSQTVDKRRLSSSSEYSEGGSRYSSSSLLLLAVGTVMSVGIVGTVAGGAYYIKKRSETPDDGEYAPYAGTGPGFKKNKGSQGDETLAYKAQLHQYQQAKQKIICGEEAPGMIESDGEDGADEENNFSVYECPGLAPTGDIEVCNPNFAVQP